MSQQARAALVKELFFQDTTQSADLDDPNVTQTQLIALLLDLVNAGFSIEVTAVKSDHHDDSALGLHSHFNGYAADVWPLNSHTPGDYMDAANPHFQDFLETAAGSPWVYQIGLAGSAQTQANREAAGHTVFDDEGADHIHLAGDGP